MKVGSSLSGGAAGRVGVGPARGEWASTRCCRIVMSTPPAAVSVGAFYAISVRIFKVENWIFVLIGAIF